MARIKLDISEYLTFITQNKGTTVQFCQGFIPLPYRGQVCKLVAGASVQQYLFNTKAHTTAPLPLHKNKLFTESLRQRAKSEINSQVGEVYGPDQIRTVFNYNYFHTESYCIKDESTYAQFLIAALDQVQPVLVYFDVTPRLASEDKRGNPAFFKGNMEHSAVIVGYYYLEEKLRLIAAQWGTFFDLSFTDLFNSTSQLSPSRKPEHFQKCAPIANVFETPTWIETDQLNFMCNYLCSIEGRSCALSLLTFLWLENKERTSDLLCVVNSSLANILTMITGDSKQIDLDQFHCYQLKDEETHEKTVSYNVM